MFADKAARLAISFAQESQTTSTSQISPLLVAAGESLTKLRESPKFNLLYSYIQAISYDLVVCHLVTLAELKFIFSEAEIVFPDFNVLPIVEVKHPQVAVESSGTIHVIHVVSRLLSSRSIF